MSRIHDRASLMRQDRTHCTRFVYRVAPMLLVLVTTSCTGGVDGQEGPQGPTGPEGPEGVQGQPGVSIVWKDATGALAERVVAHPVGGTLFHVDADGVFWAIDPFTAEVLTPPASATPYYETNDCTGPKFVRTVDVPLPRFPFRVVAYPEIRVRGDLQQSQTILMCSAESGGGSTCSPLSTCTQMDVLAVGTGGGLTLPTLPFLGPLHPELGS